MTSFHQLRAPFYMCHERWALRVVIKRKVIYIYNSNMADVRFLKSEVVIAQPWIEIS